ncbi:hypothetical protein E3W66_09860 [Gammaproteobacteria bacterium LSUCC0057]|uniref:Sulfotransferase family protein n=1 Tax=Gammaproteobacteria bacterium LSUCC0057 TaxID=2559237 RepID=A0A4Y8UH64_9GAMM|nr:hypothetical protein E3W66_09860 [Gammaproteobacteria bacterium LSUCC0057]
MTNNERIAIIKAMNNFIIWTIQRSGGTNLSDWLSQQSKTTVLHEPFNMGREFQDCVADYKITHSIEQARSSIAAVIAAGTSMKICVEEIPLPISMELAKQACRAGYSMIFLVRENSLNRLVSLQRALNTGRWHSNQPPTYRAPIGEIENLLRHQQACNARLDILHRNILELANQTTVVIFEKLYASDTATALRELRHLACGLKLNRDIHAAEVASLHSAGKMSPGSEPLQPIDATVVKKYLGNGGIFQLGSTTNNINPPASVHRLVRSRWGRLDNPSHTRANNLQRPSANAEIGRKFESILIITYGRSGSTLLQGILNSTAGVTIRGENYDFCGGLYRSYKSLVKTHNFKGHIDTDSRHAWYGANEIRPGTFIKACQHLVKQQIIGNEYKPNTIYGFKEIRYIDYAGELAEYLDFLYLIFPNPAFIFNLRNPADVSRSGFWKKSDSATVTAEIATLNQRFRLYANQRDYCFIHDYDQLIAASSPAKELFSFLGFNYDAERIKHVLSLKHSY